MSRADKKEWWVQVVQELQTDNGEDSGANLNAVKQLVLAELGKKVKLTAGDTLVDAIEKHKAPDIYDNIEKDPIQKIVDHILSKSLNPEAMEEYNEMMGEAVISAEEMSSPAEIRRLLNNALSGELGYKFRDALGEELIQGYDSKKMYLNENFVESVLASIGSGYLKVGVQLLDSPEDHSKESGAGLSDRLQNLVDRKSGFEPFIQLFVDAIAAQDLENAKLALVKAQTLHAGRIYEEAISVRFKGNIGQESADYDHLGGGNEQEIIFGKDNFGQVYLNPLFTGGNQTAVAGEPGNLVGKEIPAKGVLADIAAGFKGLKKRFSKRDSAVHPTASSAAKYTVEEKRPNATLRSSVIGSALPEVPDARTLSPEEINRNLALKALLENFKKNDFAATLVMKEIGNLQKRKNKGQARDPRNPAPILNDMGEVAADALTIKVLSFAVIAIKNQYEEPGNKPAPHYDLATNPASSDSSGCVEFRPDPAASSLPAASATSSLAKSQPAVPAAPIATVKQITSIQILKEQLGDLVPAEKRGVTKDVNDPAFTTPGAKEIAAILHNAIGGLEPQGAAAIDQNSRDKINLAKQKLAEACANALTLSIFNAEAQGLLNSATMVLNNFDRIVKVQVEVVNTIEGANPTFVGVNNPLFNPSLYLADGYPDVSAEELNNDIKRAARVIKSELAKVVAKGKEGQEQRKQVLLRVIDDAGVELRDEEMKVIDDSGYLEVTPEEEVLVNEEDPIARLLEALYKSNHSIPRAIVAKMESTYDFAQAGSAVPIAANPQESNRQAILNDLFKDYEAKKPDAIAIVNRIIGPSIEGAGEEKPAAVLKIEDLKAAVERVKVEHSASIPAASGDSANLDSNPEPVYALASAGAPVVAVEKIVSFEVLKEKMEELVAVESEEGYQIEGKTEYKNPRTGELVAILANIYKDGKNAEAFAEAKQKLVAACAGALTLPNFNDEASDFFKAAKEALGFCDLIENKKVTVVESASIDDPVKPEAVIVEFLTEEEEAAEDEEARVANEAEKKEVVENSDPGYLHVSPAQWNHDFIEQLTNSDPYGIIGEIEFRLGSAIDGNVNKRSSVIYNLAGITGATASVVDGEQESQVDRLASVFELVNKAKESKGLDGKNLFAKDEAFFTAVLTEVNEDSDLGVGAKNSILRENIVHALVNFDVAGAEAYCKAASKFLDAPLRKAADPAPDPDLAPDLAPTPKGGSTSLDSPSSSRRSSVSSESGLEDRDGEYLRIGDLEDPDSAPKDLALAPAAPPPLPPRAAAPIIAPPRLRSYPDSASAAPSAPASAAKKPDVSDSRLKTRDPKEYGPVNSISRNSAKGDKFSDLKNDKDINNLCAQLLEISGSKTKRNVSAEYLKYLPQNQDAIAFASMFNQITDLQKSGRFVPGRLSSESPIIDSRDLPTNYLRDALNETLERVNTTNRVNNPSGAKVAVRGKSCEIL